MPIAVVHLEPLGHGEDGEGYWLPDPHFVWSVLYEKTLEQKNVKTYQIRF